MKKIYIILLIEFITNNLLAQITKQHVIEDLKNNNSCYEFAENDKETILSNISNELVIIDTICNIDNFRLLYMRGYACMDNSYIVVYKIEGDKWEINNIYNVYTTFQPIEKSNRYFKSEFLCSEMNIQSFYYKLLEFKNGKLITLINQLNGEDKYFYYSKLHLAAKEYKSTNVERSKFLLDKITKGKNDTIRNFSQYNNYKFDKFDLVSCEKNEIREILLRGDYSSDSLITQKLNTKQILYFNKIKIVKSDNLYIYTTPTSKNKEAISNGTRLEILSEMDGYYNVKISSSNKEGWIKKIDLE